MPSRSYQQPDFRRSFGSQLQPELKQPSRSFSAPRLFKSGIPNIALQASLSTVAATPPHAWYRSLSTARQRVKPTASDVIQKLREWLDTIPIGNGENRGWDDKQLEEIADFAMENDHAQFSAEQIYRHFVEFQVEEAGK